MFTDPEARTHHVSKTGRRVLDKIPAATLAQRVSSMSTAELMFAAKRLAPKIDAASDQACTAILDELERRTGGSESFNAFVTEIYS